MPRGLSRRCFNKKLSQEVAARAMLVVAATVIVEGEQRVAHAVEVAADERPAHALVEHRRRIAMHPFVHGHTRGYSKGDRRSQCPPGE